MSFRKKHSSEYKELISEAQNTLNERLKEHGRSVEKLDDSLLLEHYIPETYEAIVPLSLHAKKKMKNDKKFYGIRSSLVKITKHTADIYNLEQNQIAKIASADCKTVYECTVSIVPDEFNNDEATRLEDHEAVLSVFLKNEVFPSQTEFFLIVPKFYKCSKPTAQKATRIRERSITIGKELYDSLSRYDPSYVEIRHLATGATMLKPFSQVIFDPDIKDQSTIMLTYYQRVILNLSDNDLNNEVLLIDKLDRVNYNLERYTEERKYPVIRNEKRGKKTQLYLEIPDSDKPLKVFHNRKNVTDEDWNKHKVLTIKKETSGPADSSIGYEVNVTGKFDGQSIEVDVIKDDYNNLQIIPIFSDYERKPGIGERLSDFFVGDSNLCLSAVRPYNVDDDRDIVRLSKDNMTLLGIEETDRVRIEYKGRHIHATVMSIDSFEFMKEQNILFSDADLDIIIGIPSPLRRSLGIHDVETEVFVYRDTEFIFKKNINIQLLPILALIFTVFQISMDFRLQILICIIMTPVVMILSLSQERQKVKELNKEFSKKKRKSIN